MPKLTNIPQLYIRSLPNDIHVLNRWAKQISDAINSQNSAVAAAQGVSGQVAARIVAIAAGTISMPTGAIASGASTSVSAAAPGVRATDTVHWAFNAAPGTGWASLSVQVYVQPGSIVFVISNPSAGSITPAALSANWQVYRWLKSAGQSAQIAGTAVAPPNESGGIVKVG